MEICSMYYLIIDEEVYEYDDLLSLESYIDNYNPYNYIIIYGNLVKGTVDKDGNVYG